MTTTHRDRSPWMDEELDLYRETVRRFVAEWIVPHQQRFARQQHVDRADEEQQPVRCRSQQGGRQPGRGIGIVQHLVHAAQSRAPGVTTP